MPVTLQRYDYLRKQINCEYLQDAITATDAGMWHSGLLEGHFGRMFWEIFAFAKMTVVWVEGLYERQCVSGTHKKPVV